jgi:hypothetical protein
MSCLILLWTSLWNAEPCMRIKQWMLVEEKVRRWSEIPWKRMLSLLKKHYAALIAWVILGELGIFVRYPWADEYLWVLYALWYEHE